METLFGIPINGLLSSLSIVFLIGILFLTIAAVGNRVLFKMGVRNITRRPAQTALIVLGLMLATLLISATLVTGDTMSYSIRKTALKNLGATDVIVELKNENSSGLTKSGASAGTSTYIDKSLYKKVQDALKDDKRVDGVTRIVRQTLPAATPSKQRNLPSLDVSGLTDDYAKSFGSIKTANGKTLRVSALGSNEAYLNKKAADKLDVGKGDKVKLFIGAKPIAVKVAGVFATGGKPSNESAMILPINAAEKTAGLENKSTAILISGKGDEINGAKHTSAIKKELKPILKETGFAAKPVKQDALDLATETSAQFTSIFIIFGQFSMIAGVMLIWLIFIMLAAERKIELGVMRALGSQRKDILRVFVFEGSVYALMSSLVGSLLGILVGWGIVKLMAPSFSAGDSFSLHFRVVPASIVIAYTMGLIATFAVVFLSAWRAGRVNIVRAIRDLPEPPKNGRSLKRLIGLIALIGIATFLVIGSYQSESKGQFMAGLSLLIVGIPLLLRSLRLPERAAYTIAGIGLLAAWLGPETFIDKLLNVQYFKAGMEMFFLSGIAIVTGAIWIVMHNSDLILKTVSAIFSRLKGLPPMLAVAVNYPMKNRFRTGLVLAMFSLVVFTIVFMSGLLASMQGMFTDFNNMSGGFEIRATASYANPIVNARQTLIEKGRDIDSEDVKAIGAVSMLPIDMRQDGSAGSKWTPFYIEGINAGYAGSVNYKMDFKADGYETAREVWQAVAKNKNLAVIHSSLVPAKTSYDVGGSKPDFMVSGFYREDKKLPEMWISVKSPTTGKVNKLKVIGVINAGAVYLDGFVVTGQGTVDKIMAAPINPTTYFFKLKSGVNATHASEALAKTFYANGMETNVTKKEIKGFMQNSQLMNRLMQGFMALGLVVGIAALGVIAARSVVERRRQIGMLRAIGFRRGMVQGAFIIESGFISLLAIGIGTFLGLMLASRIAEFMARDMAGITFTIPWAEIALIAGLAYVASLLTTYLPARQASKVYPAEALRYE